MSTDSKPLPAEPQKNAVNNGVYAELNDKATENLTGFFDVLIQMDLAQKQRNERSDEDDSDLQGTTKGAAQAD
jgi:hypothetical protein